MKKFGFTLAEVLITLGIIGVVAALTAPGLVLNSRNQANAARLSVVMSNLENALSNALVAENVDELRNLAWWNAGLEGFTGNLSRFLQTAGLSNQAAEAYYQGNGPFNIRGGALWLGNLFVGRPILMKNGAAIFINRVENRAANEEARTAIRNAGGSLTDSSGLITIDVNGNQMPNRLGRDIFTFYLGSNGILYPIGGTDVAIFDGGGINSGRWDNNDGQWNCTDDEISDAEGQANGSGCTGRLVENSYNMDY